MNRSNAILHRVTTETLTAAAGDALAQADAAGPVLIVVHGPDPRRNGHRLSLPAAEPTVLGRGEPAFGAAPLGDPRISSQHLEVRLRGKTLAARDLGSKNGTFIRAEPVQEATLAEGDFIQIGSTILRFAVEAPVREADHESLVGGVSAAAGLLRADIARAAGHALPVIIVGPSGAGKERVAAELHRLGGASGKLIALNCATLSAELAESELFGHERGAFTGADRPRDGMFQAANNGTLFLDEVNSLPGALQPKLLRAIQEGRVRRVGATTDVACRPRIVCATNEDPVALVKSGRFRKDLYARLHGGLIRVPGLAARREDLGWLSNAILAEAGHPKLRLTPELMWALLDHPWPLHIRGLQQCLLAHVGDATDNVLGLSPAIVSFLESQRALETPQGTAPTEGPAARPPRKAQAKRPPKEDLAHTLRQHAGRVERVAEHYDVRRQQIYRWISAHALDLGEYRDSDGKA